MKPKDFMIEEALLLQQWERAKGELRALVEMQGARVPRGIGQEDEKWKYQKLEEMVDQFVCEVENEELQRPDG